MEKRFNLKVSVRISEKCRDIIDQVSFNHLILCGKEPGEHKKFQLDKIYSATDKNEKLFENILRSPSNLMLEGFSSMVLCLGSPNSGKTYSLAGKAIHHYEDQSEPGIMIYLMRRLFSKFKHEVSLYSTYSFWCKFLFVQRDKVRNLEAELNQQDWQNNLNTKIQIKSYSHFEEIISLIYSKNNNKCHTIIELILQKETPNQQPTNSSITFVEFGSFFYNCPYREAEELSMENDIESTLHVIKNLTKAKDNPPPSNIYDSSLLTKVLKKNFLSVCSFEFLGLLDDSYQNNLKTLSFLDIIIHKKQHYSSNRSVKQEIKRQQTLLKSLYQRHRRVLNLLSRCIGMQLGYLDKHNKKRNFDGPILNTFYKTCEKIKYANMKKLQNEKTLAEINKNVQKQKTQMSEIQAEYTEKFRKLEEEKQELIRRKNDLDDLYERITNPNIKYSTNGNSLFCKLDDFDDMYYKKFISEEEQPTYPGSLMDSERESKNEGRSFKMFPTTHQITTRKNVVMRLDPLGKQKLGEKYERINQQELRILTKRRVDQMKLQIGKLFKLILNQQTQIQKQKQKLPLHHNFLLNKIKNHTQQISFDIQQAQRCLILPTNTQQNSKYMNMLQNLKIQQKIDKDILLNNNLSNSMGVISMKNFVTNKILKNT